jgi:hypothetical protein
MKGFHRVALYNKGPIQMLAALKGKRKTALPASLLESPVQRGSDLRAACFANLFAKDFTCTAADHHYVFGRKLSQLSHFCQDRFCLLFQVCQIQFISLPDAWLQSP